MQSNSSSVLVAGGIVVGPHAKIAVVSQGDSWSLPKGHVEIGETTEQTAMREIREETGLKALQLVSYLGEYERFKIAKGGIGEDPTSLRKIALYLFTTEEEVLSPEDSDNPEARWVEFDEVAEVLTHPKDKEFFLSVRDKVRSYLAH